MVGDSWRGSVAFGGATLQADSRAIKHKKSDMRIGESQMAGNKSTHIFEENVKYITLHCIVVK